MKTKLIEIHGCEHCKHVLINRFEGDDLDVYPVEISAWHTREDFEEWQQVLVNFPTRLMAERFVADYAECTANEFANDFTFSI